MTELECALDSINIRHAFHFEEFSQKFLAIQYPNFKKLGGVHDLGRDGVFENLDADPTIFMQASITDNFKKKIPETIEKLLANGFKVKILVYCTNQKMAPYEDHLKHDIMNRYGVQLDIRGQEYFVPHASASSGRIEISRQFVNKVIDNLKFTFGDSLSADLSDEFKLFSAYLQNSALNPEKGISKTAFESFLKCILSNSDGMTLHEIQNNAIRVFCKTNSGLFESRISGAIERLKHQGVISISTQGIICLRPAEKKKINESISQATNFNSIKSSLMVVLRDSSIITRDEREKYSDSIINDALLLIEQYIWTSGHFFILVQSNSRTVNLHKASLESITHDAILDGRITVPKSVKADRYENILNDYIEHLLICDIPDIIHRLNAMFDAYCLAFLMKETDDFESAKASFYAKSKFLVDADVIITALSEKYSINCPKIYTDLLKSCKDIGMQLFYNDSTINEIQTHMGRIEIEYSALISEGEQAFFDKDVPELISAYRLFASNVTFADFLNRFRGKRNYAQNIAQSIEMIFGLKHIDSIETKLQSSVERREELRAFWAQRKTRRRWQDSEAIDILIDHDVSNYSLVESWRKQAKSANEINRWLTHDGVAYQADKFYHSCRYVTMTPEFIASILSINPDVKSDSDRRSFFLAALSVQINRISLKSMIAKSIGEKDCHEQFMIVRDIQDAQDEFMMPGSQE